MPTQIAIIGAGISGLLACKHTLKMGLNPIVFESQNDVGGVWLNTISSTKLQTPKDYYQFSDFMWPNEVKENFPSHDEVMGYIKGYAGHFGILPCVKFNCRVVGIDYVPLDCDEELWGGGGKWNVVVQDLKDPLKAPMVYQMDFVILCSGKFSDLPNIPHFPENKGPEVFDGAVIHSMDYAAMDNVCAADFIKDKCVTVVGFQKSAVDVAAEVARRNGVKYPCTLLFRKVHWTVPEDFVKNSFRNLNRFSEFMIHKPHEGFFLWFLAMLLSPLLLIFSKLVESYLKWIYPLKKYNMVPNHAFFTQISSCKFTVLPANFYDKVKEGSLILKKSQSFGFSKNGLILDGEAAPMRTDVVIFATGYKSDKKIASIFSSTYFQKCITGSSAPFYRECIHPRIPQLAILGYSESPAILYTTEMRAKWLAHFLAEKFKLPSIKDMEEDTMKWENCMRRYAGNSYKRSCVSVLLQLYCNDQICRDMGCNPRRKSWFLPELFSPYSPIDYAD